MRYPEYIDEIIGRFEGCGEQAFIVGGSLRDMLIGLPPHDYDIATSALPEKTLSLFADKRVIETGIKHGTLTVIFNGEPVEITTFRIDGSYADARHPDSVSFTRSIEEDLSRRDFTVNAMAYNKTLGLVDPFGGREDIEKKLLRAVGDPCLRFSEDALRIMRLFRFSAQLGFDIDEDTLLGASACQSGLEHIAKERIASELLRLLTSPYPCRALALMAERGIFAHVLKNYSPVLEDLAKAELLPRDEAVRLALLLWGEDNDTAAEHLRSLRYAGKQITGALAVLRGAKERVADEHSARALIANTGVYAPLAACLSEVMGISPKGAMATVERQMDMPCKISDLKINGKDLASLGAKGKLIGSTLEQLLGAVIADPRLNQRDTLVRMAREFLSVKDCE
ncbi:MAG: CCA tRNA nucleotidyltransferase [Ruminococcaceae bacterium]|nr:CCA tRNA nucleotidyltransferase [Oscillospiraceae bacterium]